MRTKVVRVFDFDDTLATSSGFIRILHCVNGEPADTEAWLSGIGVTGKRGIAGSVELNTESYAEYAKSARKLILSGDLHVQQPETPLLKIPTDIVDYSGVSRITRPKQISHNMKIAAESFLRGEILGIITGRSASGSVYDITGKMIKVNNQKGIFSFMKKCGVHIPMDRIHCVGGMSGDVPRNKAHVMKEEFIEKYDPEVVVFYDDDERNLHAVSSVDGRVHCINSKEIGSGWGTVESVVRAGREKRKRIFPWSKAIKNSGIER